MGFDEWYLPKKHFLDDCESGYFECYEAGAASRQGEVDGLKAELKTLQEMHDATCLYTGCLFNERDELQKRIDDAMKYVSESPLKDVSRRAMLNFLDILKGKKDE